MHQPAITGSGVFTPVEVITNDELVAAFNAYADRWNAEHAAAIAAGEVEAKAHSSSEFILAASGIETAPRAGQDRRARPCGHAIPGCRYVATTNRRSWPRVGVTALPRGSGHGRRRRIAGRT